MRDERESAEGEKAGESRARGGGYASRARFEIRSASRNFVTSRPLDGDVSLESRAILRPIAVFKLGSCGRIISIVRLHAIACDCELSDADKSGVEIWLLHYNPAVSSAIRAQSRDQQRESRDTMIFPTIVPP